jgi:hypothetical protein
LLAVAGSWVPALPATVLLAAIAAAYLGAELGMWTMPVPQTGRQVPSVWRYRFPQPVTAALYGGLLAPGVATNVPFPSFVVVLAAAALSRSLAVGALIMATYGVTRALAAVTVASLSNLLPAADMGLGYQYRWVLKLLAVIAVAMYLGGCVATLVHLS